MAYFRGGRSSSVRLHETDGRLGLEYGRPVRSFLTTLGRRGLIGVRRQDLSDKLATEL